MKLINNSYNMRRFKSFWTWFVISLFLMLAIPMIAQDYTKSNETTFVAKQKSKSAPTPTEYTWVDSDGKSYPIYLTEKSCFIKKISKKSGKEYRKYLSKELFKEINGKTKTMGSKK